MRKACNILGYVSWLATPSLLLSFVFVLHNLVQIAVFIMLLFMVVFQIVHYQKTKIKNYGIRILITMMAITVSGFLIHCGYGAATNMQAKHLAKTIERISFGTCEISQAQIENNLEFVNTKDLLFKETYDATIYYIDGTEEKTTVYVPGFYIVQIKGNKYYIDCTKPTAGA